MHFKSLSMSNREPLPEVKPNRNSVVFVPPVQANASAAYLKLDATNPRKIKQSKLCDDMSGLVEAVEQKRVRIRY